MAINQPHHQYLQYRDADKFPCSLQQFFNHVLTRIFGFFSLLHFLNFSVFISAVVHFM